MHQVVDCEGAIRIGQSRHVSSIVQVYVDLELVAESESQCP